MERFLVSPLDISFLLAQNLVELLLERFKGLALLPTLEVEEQTECGAFHFLIFEHHYSGPVDDYTYCYFVTSTRNVSSSFTYIVVALISAHMPHA